TPAHRHRAARRGTSPSFTRSRATPRGRGREWPCRPRARACRSLRARRGCGWRSRRIREAREARRMAVVTSHITQHLVVVLVACGVCAQAQAREVDGSPFVLEVGGGWQGAIGYGGLALVYD